MTRILRLVAIAIALAGVVDPAITLSGASRAPIAVVAQPGSTAAENVRDRLTRDLSTSYDVVSMVTSDASAAVVVGDRYPGEQLPESLPVATVTTPSTSSAVRIVRIDAPQEIPRSTAIHLDVELEEAGIPGQSTDVTVAIAGLEAGRASHRWASSAERWHAGIEVVPVGEPPYVLRVEAASVGDQVRLKPDTTDVAAPNVVSGFGRTTADVVVDVRRHPFRVQFYEPRPSWATTFLRRALESDARFQVASLSFTSRGIAAQTGGEVPLNDPRLDAFDVVVVGGLDRLTAADVHSLDRFMRERGGAVVVVPDQRIDAGPARDLLASAVPLLSERLLEQPAKLTVTPPAALLQASELLVLPASTSGFDVLARVPGGNPANAPVIVSMPRGDGRLLLSGAMDAWRFRAADNNAFDRFWQSTIAGLALAVPSPIAISVAPPLLRPGETGDVVVRLRSQIVNSSSASIDGDQPIRLVPDAEPGVYRGRFTARGTPGRSTIEVRTAGAQPQSASRTLLVQPDVQGVRSTSVPSLAMLASSHRGIDVAPDHLADIERFVRSTVSAPQTRQIRHPMRSTWWILPFAFCLAAEWWTRRRRGLR